MQTTPAMQNIEDAVHGAARIPKKAHGSEAPSGHPLLSGPPTLTDIHQIFTSLA